jgi:small subunit ribosomal protein S9
MEEIKQEQVKINLEDGKYIEGIGRRKTATCRVRIFKNDSEEPINIKVNDRFYKDYFKSIELIKIVDAPIRKLKLQGLLKVTVKAKGGGMRGQAEAIRLGLSRALSKMDPSIKPKLKKSGFLTRDAREVERKKYGKKKARKSPQWHKR